MTSDGKFVEVELAADRIRTTIPYISFEMFCMANGYTEKKEKLHEDDRDFRITIDVVHLKESENPEQNQLVRRILKEYGIVCSDDKEKFDEYKELYEKYLCYDEIKEDIEAKRFSKIEAKFFNKVKLCNGDYIRTIHITVDDICKGNTPYANFFVFLLLKDSLKISVVDGICYPHYECRFKVCESEDEEKNRIAIEMFRKLEVMFMMREKDDFDFWLQIELEERARK